MYQKWHPKTAQPDSSLGVLKKCPKSHSSTMHNLREKYEKHIMTSQPGNDFTHQ